MQSRSTERLFLYPAFPDKLFRKFVCPFIAARYLCGDEIPEITSKNSKVHYWLFGVNFSTHVFISLTVSRIC